MIIDPTALTAAIEALNWIELKGFKPSYALTNTIRQLNIKEESVITTANNLIQETLKRKNLIEKILTATIPPNTLQKTKPNVKNFLKIYAYTTKLSPSRQDAIELVKTGREILGWRTLHPVEAYLGRLLTLNLTTLYNGLTDEEKTALETWHPPWFIHYCYRLLGRTEALKLLWKHVEGIPTYIHPNTLKGPEATIVARLRREKIELDNTADFKNLYLALDTSSPLWMTEAHREGLFNIEDKASYIAVSASGAKAGMAVLDISTDGMAKTVHLAQLMGNSGRIISAVILPRRPEALEKEIRKYGVAIAEPINFDPNKPLPTPIDADIAIVNPPSSRTGLFGTDPATKWKTKPEDVKNYTPTQMKVLEEGARHVKTGGTLIYTTPSIALEENEMVIERFLNLAPGFKLEKVDSCLGSPALRGLPSCVRIYPHLHNSNGGFVAKMRRTS